MKIIVSFHFQILGMIRLPTLCIALALFASAWSSSLNVEGSSKRLLVLVDTLGIRESHSFYFKQLTGRRILLSLSLSNLSLMIPVLLSQIVDSRLPTSHPMISPWRSSSTASICTIISSSLLHRQRVRCSPLLHVSLHRLVRRVRRTLRRSNLNPIRRCRRQCARGWQQYDR